MSASRNEILAHVHGPGCAGADGRVFRCLECEMLFEAGIADGGLGGERCPQCGLQNAVAIATPESGTFVLRHSSRFR
jgi:phage FluMu protein Com